MHGNINNHLYVKTTSWFGHEPARKATTIQSMPPENRTATGAVWVGSLEREKQRTRRRTAELSTRRKPTAVFASRTLSTGATAETVTFAEPLELGQGHNCCAKSVFVARWGILQYQIPVVFTGLHSVALD